MASSKPRSCAIPRQRADWLAAAPPDKAAAMAAFSPNEIEALGARAEAMVNALGAISAEPERLVRLFLTPEHRRAADRVAAWMSVAGLEVSEDALGTVRGRLERQGGKRLLIGSH